jgi:hypothetical protein
MKAKKEIAMRKSLGLLMVALILPLAGCGSAGNVPESTPIISADRGVRFGPTELMAVLKTGHFEKEGIALDCSGLSVSDTAFSFTGVAGNVLVASATAYQTYFRDVMITDYSVSESGGFEVFQGPFADSSQFGHHYLASTRTSADVTGNGDGYAYWKQYFLISAHLARATLTMASLTFSLASA